MTRTTAPAELLYNTPDAGGSGSGGGGDASFGTNAEGSGGGASAAPAPIALTHDSMVIPPGSTTPVKYGEYQAKYVERDQAQRDNAAFLQNLFKNAKNAKKPQPQAQPQARPAPPDMFAGVRDLPLIDGRTLTDLGERIQREGIGPLYEWAGKVNQVLEGINGRVQSTERAAGSLAENRSRAEFEGKMQTAAQSLAKEMLPGIDISKHPVINDFVQDVYLSYDPNDPTLEREFPGLLKSRIDGILKLAADLNQAKLVHAREQRRSFLRPGGQGQPSGPARGERLSHRAIARNIFSNDASAT